MAEYEFDEGGVGYRRVKRTVWEVLGRILRVILASLSLFVVLYILLALFLSTDAEKRLRKENRMYEKVYPKLKPKETLVSEALEGLQVKDNAIYEQVFHSEAPSVDPINSLDFLFGADTIPDAKIVTYTTAKAEVLSSMASSVDSLFERIFSSLADSAYTPAPMSLPVENLSYPQIGASIGNRFNAFYKAEVRHNGLDFIVPQGSKVFASADGDVVDVQNSGKGEGKTITLKHEGGYYTRYLHLSEIKVHSGQKVKKGTVIGSVGMTGNAFAPHLHYEVLKGEQAQNPVNYLFASVGPEEYANMLYMSVNTRQSMD